MAVVVVLGLAVRALWVFQGDICLWWQTDSNRPSVGRVFDPPVVPTGHGQPRAHELSEPGVYLAPFADFPRSTLVELQAYLEETWDFDSALLGPITIERSAMPGGNTQLDAFDLADQVQRAYKITVSRTAVIGFLSYDVRAYATGDFWNFGAVNPTGYAVISTARMDPLNFRQRRNDALLMDRLRKMMVRYIAVVYYELTYVDDPRSVLYAPIRSSADLDRMTEWPCPTFPRAWSTC